MIEPLDTRLGALADPADNSSWLEVTTRARALRRRRRAPVAVAAALALAFVVVAPAVGLRDKIIQLFDDAAPAPERVERSFASLDQGVPPRLGTGVEADRARKVFETQGVVLWLAPTTRGGFCSLVEVRGNGGGGECVTLYDRLSVDVSLHGRIALIHGFAQQKRAASLVLGFQDGESASVPLVWVSAPVDTGFFVYAVPEQHRREGHLPTTLRLLAVDGDELDRREIHGLPAVTR